MNIFDIITLAVFAIAVIICAWKGFIKIILKLGAVVIAAAVAKFVGPMLGNALIPELISTPPESMNVGTLGTVNETLASVIGTVLLFVVLFILLRIIAGLISKIITKVTHTSALDRILGAVFGFVVAFAFVVIFAKLVEIFATVSAFIDPDTAIFDTIEDTVLFKYFR